MFFFFIFFLSFFIFVWKKTLENYNRKMSIQETALRPLWMERWMFPIKTTDFTTLPVAIAASSDYITDPKYRYMSGRKIKIVLTLSVGGPQCWIAGLERQPSIIEHVHSILPSTRGATRVKLFHNVPHLDHTGTRNIHEIGPGWLFACDNTIQPGCICEFISIFKFIFDKNFCTTFCVRRYLLLST